MGGPVGNGGRIGALLVECNDATVLIHFDDAELARELLLDGDGGHRDFRALLHVKLDHLPDIHPVDMIGAENGDNVRVRLLDQVNVLPDRVSGSAIPVLAGRAHLRGDGNYEMIPQQSGNVPAFPQMLKQGLTLELDQHIYRVNAGVDEVAENEIDDAITTAERHGRFGPFLGEGVESRALAAGQ